MILDKTQILNADDTETDYVAVPEWGGPEAKVRIRSLMGDQRQRLVAKWDSEKRGEIGPGGSDALCCVMGMIDDKGARLFTAEQDAIALGRKHPEILGRIAGAILRLSNMTKAAREAAEKNFVTTSTNNGGSGSPAESTPDAASMSTV